MPDESSFARQLLLALEENKNPYIDPLMLYNEIRTGVRGTTPLFGYLNGTDQQEGASFLFFLKEKENIKEGKKKILIFDIFRGFLYNRNRGNNMTESLTKEVLSLTNEEKIKLADMILESLNPCIDKAIEKAWIEESSDRFKAYLNGNIKSLNGDEFLNNLKKKYEV